ncbi:hypothetical protein FGG08_004052 [Glutinoglossum americanum]|uniref:Uncharacterized protein n=1 Tax=Glutinoglossum americanum TaxID=1670608 RepID=A0A9P8I1B9_9PEZI|nr:hypothetical protein FGG08_004052 [Glutinoglossum americanum]
MPPIFSGLHDDILKSKLYAQSRDLLSQFSSLSRVLVPQRLARSAESVSTAAQALTKLGPLLRRQNDEQTGVIPSTYLDKDSGPSPGSVVGIVIGSVLGFLLILWLIWTCTVGNIVGEEVIRERRPSHSRRVEKIIEFDRGPRRPERVIVDARRNSLVDSSSSDDIIVETARRQSSHRPRSGIRYIDPDLPAGGNGHIEEVYRKGSGSRRSRR